LDTALIPRRFNVPTVPRPVRTRAPDTEEAHPVSITRHLRRPAGLGAIACALLVSLPSSAAVAVADPLQAERSQERYYSSYGRPDRPGPALAQERYLSSYHEPKPLTPPQSRAASDATPWLPIALSIAGALLIVAASATQARHVRTRRRAARAPS
jgi:hypothetical protein